MADVVVLLLANSGVLAATLPEPPGEQQLRRSIALLTGSS
jgi:hypothetical protein